MKKRTRILLLVCLLLLLAGILALRHTKPAPPADPISTENENNVGRLLGDLLRAWETPGAEDEKIIEADLEAIRAVNRGDYEVAKAIADHWRQVYLDPGYRLFVHRGEERAAPESIVVPDSRSHAIVVLGYQLQNGEMQPELRGRCEAAAALARALPSAILVCSGGATGGNNPLGHTEAGLMKQYLRDVCGIEAERIFTDERAMTTMENAVNTFAILQEQGVRTMTIVTSSYHQRWGQALYNAVGALYRRQNGYAADIVGNYNYETEPGEAAFRDDARIAVSQIAGLLELSGNARASLKGRH